MFHKTNFGSFGDLPCDMDGYVPQESDTDPWAFNLDHAEAIHDNDGNLTDYGEWWLEEGFQEWKEEALVATAAAEKALESWRRQ